MLKETETLSVEAAITIYEKQPSPVLICDKSGKILFSSAMARKTIRALRCGTNINRFFDIVLDPDNITTAIIDKTNYALFTYEISYNSTPCYLIFLSSMALIFGEDFLFEYAAAKSVSFLNSMQAAIVSLGKEYNTAGEVTKYINAVEKKNSSLVSLYSMLSGLNRKLSDTLSPEPRPYSTVQMCEDFYAKISERITVYGFSMTYDNLSSGALVTKIAYRDFFRIMSIALAFALKNSTDGHAHLISKKEKSNAVCEISVYDRADIVTLYKNFIRKSSRNRALDCESDNPALFPLCLLHKLSEKLGVKTEYQRLDFDKKLVVRLSFPISDMMHESKLSSSSTEDADVSECIDNIELIALGNESRQRP